MSEVKWVPEMVKRITLKPFSLHFLTGPRQVGKTTAIKILIHQLIKERDPKSIFYYACDELTDHRELGEVLDDYIGARNSWGIAKSVIFLDEITFVNEWWRALKSRIDSGDLRKDVIVVTGSASIDLLMQREMFPGRRGYGKDLVLHPLSFSAFARIRGGLDIGCGDLSSLDRNINKNKLYLRRLKTLLAEYMRTGGFPRSIHDLARFGHVTIETTKTYLDWIRGDWAKAGKSDRYMKEILSYLILARGTLVSWNSIATQTSVNSPNTVRSYIETLEGIQTILTLYRIRPDSRIEYKKNKKIHFTDPFIFKVLCDYTRSEIPEDWRLEATVAAHLSRLCPVYYWKNQSEVDVICMWKKRQIGFEVTKGLKSWKPPWHIKKWYLLDRESLGLFLSTFGYD